MSVIPAGSIVFSGFEQTPWKIVDAATGTIGSDAPSTPLDPLGGGTFGMGMLDSGLIWIANESFFYTYDPESGASNASADNTGFSGGSNGTHVYGIIVVPPATTPILREFNPTTWAITRSWTLPGAYGSYGFCHLAVNAARTILYYTSNQNAGTLAFERFSIVHRWDLTNDVALTDFVSIADGGSANCGGLHVLDDDTVVVGWRHSTGNGTRRYATDGTLLHTYARGTMGGGQGQICRGTNNSIWVNSSGGVYSTMYEYDIDTEAELTTWDTGDYATYGVSWDGPFVAPPAPSCTETTYPIRLVRRAPHLAADRKQVRHHRFELDLEAGLGPVTDAKEVLSITRSGSTATVTMTNGHGWATGDSILIAGADQSDYNGTKTITVTGATTFTFAVSNSPATPATGTITAQDVTPPVISLKWSDDGGHTWSSYYPMTAGAAGAYTTRAFRTRLGMARDRIYEVSTTDAAHWNLIAAWLDLDGGTS